MPFAGAAAAGVARESGPAPTQRRRDLRAPIAVGAVGAIVLAVSALTLFIGNPFRPTGGVESAFATPAAVTSASPSPGLLPLSSPEGGLTGTTGASADASPVQTAATPVPSGTSALPSGRTASSSSATPTPTPTPHPTPPPASTPTPTPALTPTPVCQTVPNLVALTVSNARAAWTAAGFTGSFSPEDGLNNKTVLTQSETAGACLPATTTIAVTYS